MNNSLRNYSYIVKSKGLGICIDPFDPELISQYLEKEQIELVSILNTHEHWDHLCGNEKLSELTGAQVRGILSPGKYEVAGIDIEVWPTPGHSAQHVGLLFRQGEKKAYFCGDTIFHLGVGHCKLGGDPEILFKSIQEIKKKIDSETFLYVGHDYFEKNKEFSLKYASSKEFYQRSKTFGEELAQNIFLQTNSIERFVELRQLRDIWS